jgi:hypothetical protein
LNYGTYGGWGVEIRVRDLVKILSTTAFQVPEPHLRLRQRKAVAPPSPFTFFAVLLLSCPHLCQPTPDPTLKPYRLDHHCSILNLAQFPSKLPSTLLQRIMTIPTTVQHSPIMPVSQQDRGPWESQPGLDSTHDVSHISGYERLVVQNHNERCDSESSRLDTNPQILAPGIDIVDSKSAIEALTRDTLALEWRNEELEATVKAYSDYTHVQQILLEKDKEDLKRHMAFVKQHEGQLIHKRRVIAAEQELQRKKEQQLDERAARLEKASAELATMDNQLKAKEQSLNEWAFCLHLKEEAADKNSVALRVKQEERSALQVTMVTDASQMKSIATASVKEISPRVTNHEEAKV